MSEQQRFAIYTRYSSDMQDEISLEAQEHSCRQAIADRDGIVVQVFSDSAKSGWSLDRDGFNALRKAAEKGKFDAIMFWKFDRLARGYEDMMIIKMLLRQEYDIRLYCVEGYSEDDDNSEYAALMEQMFTVFYAFYSQTVSRDTKRGKKHRAMRGEFNGSIAPFGYTLVKKGAATPEKPAGLHVQPQQAAIVRQAFELYAAGQYSHRDIANWMNEQPLVRKMREGKKPAGKEMVRDLLQNRVYTGRVPYAETIYTDGIGKGKKSSRKRKTWYEGRHEAIISDELFEQCQAVLGGFVGYDKKDAIIQTYLLHDRVYCARCVLNKPDELTDENYAKMRVSWNPRKQDGDYRCLSAERGYQKCGQKAHDSKSIDTQVIGALSNLTLPPNRKNQVLQVIQDRISEGRFNKRVEEVRSMIQNMDIQQDKGVFASEVSYLGKREQLIQEINELQPLNDRNALEAADLIQNFATHWKMCEITENPIETQKHLLQRIVERVYLYDGVVVGIAIYGGYITTPVLRSPKFQAIGEQIQKLA